MPDLHDKLSRFEKSWDLSGLENLLRWPNIFSILGISRTEICHSNFLAWLFNPRANHGLGDIFLRELCRAVSINLEGLDLSDIAIRREVKLESTAGDRQIDLLITHEQFVIVLENKIDAIDSAAQLRDYKTIADTRFPEKTRYYIYMTPSGDDPTDKTMIADYRLYSYQQLCKYIDDILDCEEELNDIQQRVHRYLADYSENMRRIILGTDNDLLEQANEIYRKHKEAIDFIIENKSALTTGLFAAFADRVQTSGWREHSSGKGCIRFLTPALEQVIPVKRIAGRESFLFELFFDPRRNKDTVVFKATIFHHHPRDQRVKDLLIQAVERVPIAEKRRKTGVNDVVPILAHYDFVVEEDADLNAPGVKAGIEAQIDSFWPRIESLVKQVEAAILDSKADLEQCGFKTEG